MITQLTITLLTLIGPALGHETPDRLDDRVRGETGGTIMIQTDDPVWSAFEMDELAAHRTESGSPWLPFLDVSTMNVGLYVLSAGGRDDQKPHELDELYYVVNGRATLQIEGEEQTVGPGSLVYVKAKAAHHFHSIEEELRVLVFFSKKERDQ